MITGLDGSNVNTTTAFTTALAGAAFAVCKTTEGVTFVDTTYTTRIAAVRAAGKLAGAYHFAHPLNDDPTQQARFFLATAKPQPGDLLALDLEATDTLADVDVRLRESGRTRAVALLTRKLRRTLFQPEQTTVAQWAQIAVNACTFADTIRSSTGVDPVLYSFPAFLNPMLGAASSSSKARLLGLPLWIADPNHPAGQPILCGWSSWLLQQHGIRLGLDADILNGDPSTWRAHAVPAPTPAPIPTPTPPAPTPKPRPAGGDMFIFRVTDGPNANEEIYDYGFGPVHIAGDEAAALAAGGVKTITISGAIYARRFPGV